MPRLRNYSPAPLNTLGINHVVKSVLMLCCFVTATAAQAGSFIVMDVGTASARHESTAWVDTGRIAITQSNMDGYMLFDKATSTVTMVDHAQKSYVRMDEAKIERIVGMASGVMGAMAGALESLQNLPEAQRKAAEDMMKNMGLGVPAGQSGKKVVTPTEELRTVNGVRCKMHNVMSNGAAVSQACIASAAQTGIESADWETIQSMRKMWIKFADRATPLIEKFGAGLPDISAVGVDGLPVMLIRGGKPEMLVRTIGRGKAPANVMSVPSSYSEKNLPLM